MTNKSKGTNISKVFFLIPAAFYFEI